MDLFVHMYDVCKRYRPPLEDRLNALFRDHDFYSRLREFTFCGETDVLSYIFPEGTPRQFRLVSLSITRLTTEADTTLTRRRPLNPRVLEQLVESSSESLKRLSISPCTIDLDRLLIVRQLTHLSLVKIDPPSTIKNLLFFLQANPGLEELLLHYEGYRQGVEVGEELPPVSFARLRKLRVTLQTQDVEDLFGNLHILSEVEEVEVAMEGFENQLPETVCRWFNDVVSPRAVQCVEARPSSYIFGPVVSYIRNTDSIQHPSLPHHSTFVGLRFRPPELLDFLSLQVVKNATRLELFHDDLSTSQYLEIFKRTSALQELVAWAGRECKSVRALLPAVRNSQEDGENKTYFPHVPLSSLSHLRIIEADLGEIEDDDGSPNEAAILDLVRQRRHLGFGLQRLELVCCEHVCADWVDRLRSFVPEVFWDGQDGSGWSCSGDSEEDYCPSSAESGDSGEDSDKDHCPSSTESDGDSHLWFTESEESESEDSSQGPPVLDRIPVDFQVSGGLNRTAIYFGVR